MNFTAVQKKYPDAHRIRVTLKVPGKPVSIEAMRFMAGGGKILYHHLSKDGKRQTMYCSIMAGNEQG